MRAGDVFGKLLAAGITAQIIVQALINIAAITGLVPLTGIPLPFFSYGSSSLLITMLEIGILLNISKSIRSAKPSI
jgi:cell division protein FtsW